jgi:hypothetical protein
MIKKMYHDEPTIHTQDIQDIVFAKNKKLHNTKRTKTHITINTHKVPRINETQELKKHRGDLF